MSRAATAGPRSARSPLAAIVRYTLRACVPAQRSLLLLPVAGAVLFGLLSRLSDETAVTAFAQVGGTALHTLVLPITCLVIGDALLGAEIRSGVFAFTWLSPVRYSTIVLGRWLGGCLIAAAILVPAVGRGRDRGRGARRAPAPAVVAAVAGAAAYLALFLAIGATFKRPVVWSLALVILVERLLGAALAGIAQLSPGWLAQAVLVGLTDAGRRPAAGGHPPRLGGRRPAGPGGRRRPGHRHPPPAPPPPRLLRRLTSPPTPGSAVAGSGTFGPVRPGAGRRSTRRPRWSSCRSSSTRRPSPTRCRRWARSSRPSGRPGARGAGAALRRQGPGPGERLPDDRPLPVLRGGHGELAAGGHRRVRGQDGRPLRRPADVPQHRRAHAVPRLTQLGRLRPGTTARAPGRVGRTRMAVELIPSNEAERLAAVRRYDVLDTPPDGAFDRITALAARLFDVPIAIVSIVDTDRIWFKSHHGLDVEEIGREAGLCASAILHDGPWLVTDAAIDPRTLANPLVAGEFGLRFYAGVPLTTHDGYNLGTLCVIDHEPRETPAPTSWTPWPTWPRWSWTSSSCACRPRSRWPSRPSSGSTRRGRGRSPAGRPPAAPAARRARARHRGPLPRGQPRTGRRRLLRRRPARAPAARRSWATRAARAPRAASLTGTARWTLRTVVVEPWTPAGALGRLNSVMVQAYENPERYCTVALASIRPMPRGGSRGDRVARRPSPSARRPL